MQPLPLRRLSRKEIKTEAAKRIGFLPKGTATSALDGEYQRSDHQDSTETSVVLLLLKSIYDSTCPSANCSS